MRRIVLSLLCLFGFFQSSFAQDEDQGQSTEFEFIVPPKTGYTYFKASGLNVKYSGENRFGDEAMFNDTTIYVENENEYCIQRHMGECSQFYIFFSIDSNIKGHNPPFLIEMLNKEGRPIQIFITLDGPLTMNYIFRNLPINTGIYHVYLDQVNKTRYGIEQLNWEDYKVSIKKAKRLLNPIK